MKRILAVFLIISSLAYGFSVLAESNQVSALDSSHIDSIDKKVEKRIDRYIDEFDLTEECKEVIIEYMPDVNQFDWMKQDGFSAYSIYTKDGTEYYLTVMKDKTPMLLQSAEEDYKMRTRYYDRFAK